MIYFIASAFFIGIALGYIICSFLEEVNKSFKLHASYLEETRKTLDEIFIGNEVQIGAYNIISGLGGIIINDQVTLSARVSLYSSSHLTNMPENKGLITSANTMAYSKPAPSIKSPLVIFQNAWLGINVLMFRGTVGENSFIKPNSVILSDIPRNSRAEGNPAISIGKRFF